MSEVFNQSVLDAINRAVQDGISTTALEVDGTPQYCIINAETREIEIPGELNIFGVESDEKSTRVYFRCPKYVGTNVDLDMTQCMVYVPYRNANGEKDQYIVTDLNETEDGENVEFTWLISRKASAYMGITEFGIRAIKTAVGGTIEAEWNTTVASANVIRGMDVGLLEFSEENTDAIAQAVDLVKQEIELKGQETIATIPSDYTTTAQNALSAKNEVEDIRVGFDGTEYERAGEAVRSQIDKTYKHSISFIVGSSSGEYDNEFNALSEIPYNGGVFLWNNAIAALSDLSENAKETFSESKGVYLAPIFYSSGSNLFNSRYVSYIIACDFNRHMYLLSKPASTIPNETWDIVFQFTSEQSLNDLKEIVTGFETRISKLEENGGTSSELIVVDKNGKYTSIQDAVNATSETRNQIFIKNGVYEETIDVRRKSYPIHFTGESREGTILQNGIADYANPPMSICKGSLKNMTIKAYNDDIHTPDEYSYKNGSYAVHVDNNANAINGQLVIDNCDLISEWNAAIGIGLYENQEIIIRNSFLKSDTNWVSSNSYDSGINGALIVHGNANTPSKGQTLSLENCLLRSVQNNTAFRIMTYRNVSTDDITLKMYKNIFYSDVSKSHGNDLIRLTKATEGDEWNNTDNIFLDGMSYMNSIPLFNAGN